MNGRVLNEEELKMIEAIPRHSLSGRWSSHVKNLIATIRDLEEMVGSWRCVCEKLEQQNTILREALESVKPYTDVYTQGIISEALAKVGELK